MRSAWLVFAMLVACGGDDDGRPPAAPDTGGSASGGSGSDAGSSSLPEAGADGDPIGAGGAGSADAGAGGGIVYEIAGAPAEGPAGACDPMMMPGDDEAQDLGVSGAKLLSMTPDERTIAFSTGSGDSAVLYVADRKTTSVAFTVLEVTLAEGYSGEKGVALSGDGRSLIVVKGDDSGFGELSRAALGQAFGAAVDETRFAQLNGLKETTGRSLGWPVVSSDGHDLYYVSYFGQSLVMQSSAGQAGVFEYGAEIDEFTLGGAEDEHKLPSGISADQRALFFFDQATGHAMALFRSRPGAPFYDPLDLGEREGVVPNESCTRLYSSVASGLVFQATDQ